MHTRIYTCANVSTHTHSTHNGFKLEESPQQIVDIQGRLHERVKFWEEVLQASPQIMNCIVEGYKFPQLSLPLSL